MTLKELSAALDSADQKVEVGEINKKIEALLSTDAPEDKKEEQNAEPEVKDEPEAQKEEQKAEPEAKDEPEEKTLSVIAGAIDALTQENKRLQDENAKLAAKLAAKEQEEAEFINKYFKGGKLNISLSTESVPEDVDDSTNDYVYTDGMGELK